MRNEGGVYEEFRKIAPAVSALPPKTDIGTGTCIIFDAATQAAWRYLLRSAGPRLFRKT